MSARQLAILVADDDPDLRLVMRAALRKAGYDVSLAVNGEDTLRQYRARAFDMVMLDVEMPDMLGHEVCALLRAESGPLLPIVMVTGMDDVASIEMAYQHGATDFIAKPVNWALIGHRVRYLLRSHQAMLDLGAAQARNAAILDAIPDLLFEVDVDGVCTDHRVSDLESLDAPLGPFLGRNVSDILPGLAADVCMAAIQEALEKGSSSGGQFELALPKGKTWFELSVSRKSVAAGDKALFVVLSRDITDRKTAQDRIAHLAFFDSLTGLPNRRSFLDRVDREIRRANQIASKLAVLFMDLDGFKNINDTMGHAAGDLVLQMAAARLRDGLRPSDLLSRPQSGSGVDADIELARLGGDEFTAMVLQIDRPQDAVAVAQRIGHHMRRPFALNGRDVTLTISVGIALYPNDGPDGATLLMHADTAMYRAKSTGRDNVQIYSASLTDEILTRMALEESLKLALQNGEFHLVYQPKVDVATGCAGSVEALIRWVHPVRGLVSPAEFIPQAEEFGLIEAIGQWALRTACADAQSWNRAGHAVGVAVNLSPLQFRDPGLAQTVIEVLAQSGLAHHLLEIEITEGALMEHSDATRTMLHALHTHGVCISLDDFGTGYSSLAYLTRMPISHIKIDRCFINGMMEVRENEAIVRAVLAMAHSLGMKVTAEGVETREQANALHAMACDCLQGFYFSRPVLASEIPALLSRRWHLPLVAD